MENNFGIITLLPILITLSIVLFKKDVFLSLLIEIITGFTIIILKTSSIIVTSLVGKSSSKKYNIPKKK